MGNVTLKQPGIPVFAWPAYQLRGSPVELSFMLGENHISKYVSFRTTNLNIPKNTALFQLMNTQLGYK